MKKITKTQLKSMLKKGETKVWLCPSKCYPNAGHPFNCAIQILLTNDSELDSIINNFSYYNCDAERGMSVHYYV
jgi:hypothetical protein